MTKSPDAPRIVTPYPGPRAREILDRLRAAEGSGLRTSGADSPLVVESAVGSVIHDPDGNAFVDLYASFAAANLGHSHPEVVTAIREQAGRAMHISSGFGSAIRADVVEALRAVAPPGLDRVVLGITGADANETALKLARSTTGRREVIAFSGGYFGRLSGVVGLNGKSGVRTAVGLPPDAHFFPFPYPYRWRHGPRESAGAAALELVAEALESPGGLGPVAAMVVEPVQGNGGVVIPPDDFLPGLRRLCDEHGILLIFDEVQSGFGRTGRLWAGEHWGVVPDLMTVGKGIGGGMAVSAVLGPEAILGRWKPGVHTSTFLTNAVNLAAARAALEVMSRERLWERSANLGTALLADMACDLGDLPWVGEVRGLGLFIGIEIVTDQASRQPDPARATRIRETALSAGVVVGGGGHFENVIKLTPPLTIAPDLLAAGVRATVAAIRGTA